MALSGTHVADAGVSHQIKNGDGGNMWQERYDRERHVTRSVHRSSMAPLRGKSVAWYRELGGDGRGVARRYADEEDGRWQNAR